MKNAVFLVGIIFLIACQKDKEVIQTIEPYTGPLSELKDIEVLYSDSAVVKIRMTAPTQYEFESQDREYPDGLFIEFFERDGTLSTTLKADYGYFTAKTNIYQAKGNVIIEDFKAKQKLNTEELFWNQKKETIYTEKFVRIETEKEILMGEGLTAAQDFSTYTILKSSGTITLDQ